MQEYQWNITVYNQRRNLQSENLQSKENYVHICTPKNIERSEKEGKGRLHRKPSKAIYNNSCWTAEVTFLSHLLDRFHPELVFLYVVFWERCVVFPSKIVQYSLAYMYCQFFFLICISNLYCLVQPSSNGEAVTACTDTSYQVQEQQEANPLNNKIQMLFLQCCSFVGFLDNLINSLL